MSSIFRPLIGPLAGLLLLSTAVVAQTSDKTPVKPVAAAKASPADAPIHLIAGAGEDGIHVHQRVDGNVAGRVFRYDDTGTAQPTRARVSIAQRGQFVATVRADEWGRFQVVGLRPGVYSVLVASSDGAAAAAIRVIPFEASGVNNPSVLNISLIPSSELDLLNNMLRPGELAPAANSPQAATPAAGAGGGGGGLGGLLGAAGMGLGIGGLSGGGGGGGGGGAGPAASTFLPAVPDTSTGTGTSTTATTVTRGR